MIDEDIVSIVQIATDGSVTETYTRNDAAMSVTTNTITVTGASFTNTDTFVVYTNVYNEDNASSGGSSAGGSGIMVGNEIGSYTFDASAQTVTISGMGTLNLEDILLITNVTDQEVIYSPSDESK